MLAFWNRCNRTCESAATFFRLPWRAMGWTATAVAEIDPDAWKTQATALYADGQDGDQK
jgi:hypothetical protein